MEELPSVGRRYPITPRGMWRLPQLAREADVVHLWGYWGFHNLVYRFSSAYRQTPYVISALNMMPIVLGSRKKKAVFHKLVGLPLLARAARALALTEREAAEYQSHGVSADRVRTITDALPDEFFRAVTPPDRRSTTGRILFVGRLHEVKGIQFVLPVLAKLRSQVPNFKLLLVGPDRGYRPVLERMTRDLGLSDCVEFCGPAYGENKVHYFQEANIFIVPSLFETIGHSTLEGAAAALPCVYTRGCEFPALARAGGGFETDGSEAQLSEALFRLLRDPELCERMGRAARTCVAGGYLWSQVGPAYAATYREVVEQSVGSSPASDVRTNEINAYH